MRRRSKIPTKKKTRKPIPTRHPISPRAKTERMLGRKLLKGEIPVVPPNLIRCPVPASHVKDFEDVCAKFARGEISEADVQAKVSESLKGLKPKPVESKPEVDGKRLDAENPV